MKVRLLLCVIALWAQPLLARPRSEPGKLERPIAKPVAFIELGRWHLPTPTPQQLALSSETQAQLDDLNTSRAQLAARTQAANQDQATQAAINAEQTRIELLRETALESLKKEAKTPFALAVLAEM